MSTRASVSRRRPRHRRKAEWVSAQNGRRGGAMNRTPRWAVGSLLLLLVWHTAPVLAQEQAPFQLRVTGGCAVGSSIRQINLDGTVVCQSAVTSVDTGSGLTGGPVTTSGPLRMPPREGTSAHIADGTVAAVDRHSAPGLFRR